MEFKNNLNNKYDLLFFPRMNSEYIENEKIISYFIKKGHRLFYFDINSKKIDRKSKNLGVVTLEKNELNFINYKLDNVIKKKLIKDCVIILEDPRWQAFIIYLKRKYAFKVIFNYSQEVLRDRVPELSQFRYDNRILEISDKIIIYSPKLYLSKAIKNNGVDIINTICTSEYIEKVIKDIHGLVSIIIVTFNNLAFTKLCINSIFTKTAYPNYELIIVDNNSNDETPIYLIRLQKIYPNITVILNKKNDGFAKANNIGIRQAKGDYIILLNNDTMVTKGWITGFVKHLDRDDNLGLIGPVSNGSANESKIDINYTSFEEIENAAEEYTSNNFNKLYWNLRMLLMFCIAMKRRIIDEVGYLDESFGVGMFEDDDYSYRVKLKGYKIACAEDVFIYHYGSASLNKLKRSEYEGLFMKNKLIYEKKWNTVWERHSPHRENSSIQ